MLSVCLTIGGQLPSDKIEELCDDINGYIYDIPSDINEELNNIGVGNKEEEFTIEGCVDGDDNSSNLLDVFISHGLSIKMSLTDNGEPEGIWFWIPGMKYAEYVSEKAETRIKNVAPLINMLLNVAEKGMDCLPLYQHKKELEGIVLECIKGEEPTLQILKRAINKFIPLDEPEIPEIPCLEIIPGK